MFLGDILAAQGLVNAKDVGEALERQHNEGGSLSECLIDLGRVTRVDIDAVLRLIPVAPASPAETGVPRPLLLNLLLKAIYDAGVDTEADMGELLALSPAIVSDLLDEAATRHLVAPAGPGLMLSSQPRYLLTVAGMEWAQAAMRQNGYVGPAPVPLDDFRRQVERQKITNERVTQADIELAFGDIEVDAEMIERLGPAINSGRSILLYGPPGNGKTAIAVRLSTLFKDVIYVPHCIEVDGQILKVFDAAVHHPVEGQTGEMSHRPMLHRENFDRRWEACWRPVVVTGGELNLEMLDAGFNPESGFYEAPLHVKALGGVFIIDDFGRQLVSPRTLLNRWIVPMENRVEHLKLKTGKSFSLPFDELLIFSTNLTPSELMDAAFLRRLPYKIEIGAPSPAAWRRIFMSAAASAGITADDALVEDIMAELTERHAFPLAAYQPRFLVEQVCAMCRFENLSPRFEPHFVSMALSNMHTRDTPGYDRP